MTLTSSAEQQAPVISQADQLRILLIEDSALDAQLLESRLEDAGLSFTLRRVQDHRGLDEALASDAFDVILSDYNIPGYDGLVALKSANTARPEVPFLFVSGALGEDKAIELLKRGATDYVLKDRLERLVPSMQRALREAHEKHERRRAETMLRERERTLSTLMANLPGMAFRSRPDAPWPLEFASEGCLALTGYPPETFYLGGAVTWASIIHADDLESVQRASEAAFAAREQLTVTYRIRTRDSGLKWVWDRSLAQYGDHGEVTFIEGFVTDITQQRAAEEELRQHGEFEKQLIGIVSHDLRNPLNAITLAAAALLRREGLDEKNTNSARRILTSADRASRMIRDLLDFTQVRLGGGIPVEHKLVDLHAQVSAVVEEFQHTHSEREVLLTSHGDTHGEWDPDRIAQAVSNLVSNALKYSPKGTPVLVSTRGEPDVVVVEVQNQGDLIAHDRLPDLFKPLSRGVARTDMQTRSIGLGLYIVESIVRAHGGTIEARSTVEDGTVFTMRLPRRPHTDPVPRA
ncbi:MAG: sensor signal transduction histidine kinase [Myxococcaceae bacterium]|nr:sensor signal transduction histidine kinase [Myxococcaceae bacterium]